MFGGSAPRLCRPATKPISWCESVEVEIYHQRAVPLHGVVVDLGKREGRQFEKNDDDGDDDDDDEDDDDDDDDDEY